MEEAYFMLRLHQCMAVSVIKSSLFGCVSTSEFRTEAVVSHEYLQMEPLVFDNEWDIKGMQMSH